jgi:hypothetical protein
MFEKCPKHRISYRQPRTEEGFAAAKAGKPLSALEETDIGPWDPGARMAWIYGWEGGGGDIMTKVVVTERQRLENHRDKLRADLAHVEARIAGLPQSEEASR